MASGAQAKFGERGAHFRCRAQRKNIVRLSAIVLKDLERAHKADGAPHGAVTEPARLQSFAPGRPPRRARQPPNRYHREDACGQFKYRTSGSHRVRLKTSDSWHRLVVEIERCAHRSELLGARDYTALTSPITPPQLDSTQPPPHALPRELRATIATGFRQALARAPNRARAKSPH